MKFEGIYVPVVTPYQENFSIDFERLAEIIEFLINAGVHGIISAGTTGEYYAQTMQERFELMKFIRQQIKGRVAFIVGTGAIRTEESIEYASAAAEVGADALLVATPPYAIPTEQEMRCMRWPSTVPQICRSYSTTIPGEWVRIWAKTISTGLLVHQISARSRKVLVIQAGCICSHSSIHIYS